MALLEKCRVRALVEAYGQEIAEHVAAGEGVMLLGGVGTGKSSAAALVCGYALKAELSIAWQYVPDLCDLLMHDARRRTEYVRMQTGPRLLVWDDFGVRPLSDWEIGMLDQVVENRHRRRKPMVVTTNLTVEQLQKDVRLQRMVDRWRQRSRPWQIGGRSMRGLG